MRAPENLISPALYGKPFFGDNGFQNIFVYQRTFYTLELQIDKGTNYIIGWKSKGLFESKLHSLLSTLLPNMKYFGYKIEI